MRVCNAERSSHGNLPEASSRQKEQATNNVQEKVMNLHIVQEVTPERVNSIKECTRWAAAWPQDREMSSWREDQYDPSCIVYMAGSHLKC